MRQSAVVERDAEVCRGLRDARPAPKPTFAPSASELQVHCWLIRALINTYIINYEMYVRSPGTTHVDAKTERMRERARKSEWVRDTERASERARVRGRGRQRERERKRGDV